MGLLHLLTLSLFLCFSDAKFSGKVGVNYGTLGNNLPSASRSVELIKSLKAARVKIYNTEPAILSALKNTNIPVSVMVPNEIIVNISKSQNFSDEWVRSNIRPFYPETKIQYLLVGNEVLSNPDPAMRSGLVPAMRKIKKSLRNHKILKVKVGTTLAMDVLKTSFPPSSGEFKPEISGSIMKPMLQFLSRTKSFLFVDVYPYFAWISDPKTISLDYALLSSTNVTFTDPKTNLTYHNLFDQMVDSLVFAMERIGFNDVRIWIAETGWPNGGDYEQIGANIYNAATYNRNIVKKLAADPPLGTPARPGRILPSFIFSLYNENQKPGAGTERHFGMIYPNGTGIYEIDLSGETSHYDLPLPAPVNNEGYKGDVWCVVARGANWTALGEALSYACSQGNKTCDAIRPGGACNRPDSVVLHASYAFSAYWSQFRKMGGSCYFNGLATETIKDPSYGRCKFPSVTL